MCVLSIYIYIYSIYIYIYIYIYHFAGLGRRDFTTIFPNKLPLSICFLQNHVNAQGPTCLATGVDLHESVELMTKHIAEPTVESTVLKQCA